MSVYSINLKSNILAGPTNLSVVMPNPQRGTTPCEFYGSEKKYRVLWLLHGGSGDRHDWLRNTSIAQYAEERQFITVIPDALNSDFANQPQFADGYNFCNFFFEELMPFIYNWFPASEEREDNFLAGFSMGGAATWMYGLLHPDKFQAIAPLSSPPKDYSFLKPNRSLTSSEFVKLVLLDKTAFPSGFGPPGAGLFQKEINMIAKYQTVGDFLDSYECTWDRFCDVTNFALLPQIFVTCGTEERSFAKLEAFKEVVDRLGASNVTFEFVAGSGHNYAFWNSMIPKVLDFFKL